MSRAGCAATVCLAAASPANGEEGGAEFELRSALKVTGLATRSADDPLLFPETVGAASLWRLRFEPEARLGSWLVVTAAYEQRLEVATSGGALSGAVFLPPTAPAPYRISQLDWPMATAQGLTWYQEIDRAAVSVHEAFVDLTIGRQAIGWGRGILFGAIDIFAPFSPLEVDREWRRGVDAARAEVRLGARFSAEAVAAFGETWSDSALAGRVRGYAGPIDVEIVGGKRAEDSFVGAATSASVGGAEVHGELAFFYLPESWFEPGTFGNDRLIAKAVLGASYTFNVGDGLHLIGEYHYSGFGAEPSDLTAALTNPDFQARYLRGDTQILGRQALALVLSYPLGITGSATLQWLQDPVDGSGIVAPAVSVDLGENVSLLGGLYVGYGKAPQGLMLRSQFGTLPVAGLMQIRIYDSRSTRRNGT